MIRYILSTLLLITGTPTMATNTYDRDVSHLLQSEQNTINIFRSRVKSVVNVSNVKRIRRGFLDFDPMEIPQGAGSGFVWDTKGHIVTNYHVVHGGESFLISFHKDKKQYKAELVGAEPRKDIAVLKLIEKPKTLYPIQVGKSSNLVVGQKAVAIGNPFGLDHTVTSGIISALDRKIQGIGGVQIYGMIQTDASINPGNSGGPLIDSSGSLIGMNTMIFSKSGTSAGVGFAVPVDTISRIVPSIITHGKVSRPGLGIVLLDEHMKSYLGIEKGIVIKSIDPQSSAAQAGLKPMQRDPIGRYYLGDIILEIDGKEVNNLNDIYHLLEKYKVGDSVKVKYDRDGKTRQTKVKLIEL